jgi:hypothetical protein
MKLISFTTDIFESKEVKPHFINDRCFGEDLAAWLVDKLAATRFECGDPFQEDWGWATIARSNGEVFTVGVGIMDDSIGQDTAEWMVMIDKMRKFVFFGSKDSPARDELCREVEAILRSEPAFHNVRRIE